MGDQVGRKIADGAGNLRLKMHGGQVDFAVWCSYKYLNAGPGGLAGCFVHEMHGKDFELPRFAGWWGHNKESRFKMPDRFDPMPGAEGWQLSNPPIFQLAALRASLELFERATMVKLRAKGDVLTSYLEYLLRLINEVAKADSIASITPAGPSDGGSKHSVRLKGGRSILEMFMSQGVVRGLEVSKSIQDTT